MFGSEVRVLGKGSVLDPIKQCSESGVGVQMATSEGQRVYSLSIQYITGYNIGEDLNKGTLVLVFLQTFHYRN